MAARPTGPESQVGSRLPLQMRIAWPIITEAAQMTARDAYAPTATRAGIVWERRTGP
jgi:hypothetical protein